MFDRMYSPTGEKIMNAHAELCNKDLWNRFNKNETEMIITKSGRRIFPILKIELQNLDPDKNYCILLEMQLVTPNRLKFTAENGWVSSGVEETPYPGMYIHPESPSTGEHWMSQPVNFEKCKLTNSSIPGPNSLVLSSMHKYVPKIILVETHNLQHVRWCPSKTFYFKETEFVAVTAYQNNSITALKIDYNPFAKGFRENGKSRCKKKLFEMEMKQSVGFSKSPSPSEVDKTKPVLPEPLSYSTSPQDPTHPIYEHVRPYYPEPIYSAKRYSPPPISDTLEYYHRQVYQMMHYMDYYPYPTAREKRENRSSRTLTDFSIRSIMGKS